ncbi:MAG: hypothetical protein IJ247_04090 [Bacilli bacterium]|nr:hypothetical protein [Bacilli bacterium]
MKKSLFTAVLASILILTGCGGDNPPSSEGETPTTSTSKTTGQKDNNKFSDEYASDEDFHWHPALDGSKEIDGKEEHTFTDWYTERETGAKLVGIQERRCKVCGYTERKEIDKQPLIWIKEIQDMSTPKDGHYITFMDIILVNEETFVSTTDDIYIFTNDGGMLKTKIDVITLYYTDPKTEEITTRSNREKVSFSDLTVNHGVALQFFFDTSEDAKSFKSSINIGQSFMSTVNNLYRYKFDENDVNNNSEIMYGRFEYLTSEYGGTGKGPITGTYSPQAYTEVGVGDFTIIMDLVDSETIKPGETKSVTFRIRNGIYTYVCPFLSFSIKYAGKLIGYLTITKIPNYHVEEE